MKENITEQWGETVNGIIEVLEKVEETQISNYFDPYLNEYLEKLDDFISAYVPKEDIVIEDQEMKKDIEKIKIDYIKKGLYAVKVFMINLFTEKEIKNPQIMQKELYNYMNELYEFTSFCDLQNKNSITNRLFSRIDDNRILYRIEKIKRKCILIGFLLGKPTLMQKLKN